MPHAAAFTVLDYHERTKHHYDRYARSAGVMDWTNQPNPFRFYEDCTLLPLDRTDRDISLSWADLVNRQTMSAAIAAETISVFLAHSLGLAAWKQAGSTRWSLRINPSSGNLHPTEAHLILPDLDGQGPGLYHYNPFYHALERRAAVPADLWQDLERHLGGVGFCIGLTAIHWREAWKYGERAWRYVNLDAGHALVAASLAAALCGWRLSVLHGMADGEAEALLGLDRTAWPEAETEEPEVVCAVVPAGRPGVGDLTAEILAGFATLPIAGRPNRLSPAHVDWDIIGKAATSARKPRTPAMDVRVDRRLWQQPVPNVTAARLIRQRRSATAYDPKGWMARQAFAAILERTLPRAGMPPFDALAAGPAIDLLVFVHRVNDLAPGLYLYLRQETDRCRLASAIGRPLTPVPGIHGLLLLEPGDWRRVATKVSCVQDIAGDGVFSLGMIGELDQGLATEGYRYRQLFCEAGMVGQMLYLEAEAQGFRGTGIGCFFDDPVRELAGLDQTPFHSLYHFTVGRPVEDPRLSTLPAYHHLAR